MQSAEISRTIVADGSSELLRSIPDRFWTCRQEETFNKKFHEKFTSALRARRDRFQDAREMVVQEVVVEVVAVT